MKIIKRVAVSKIEFTNETEKLQAIINDTLHMNLGVKIEGIEYSPAYKSGYTDGLKAFYNVKTQEFATGLVKQVDETIKKLQRRYTSIEIEYVDEYPERWVEDHEFPVSIELPDSKLGKIELRDYQYRSAKEAVLQQTGIVHVATNGGKCFTADTTILTDKGMLTVADLFAEQGLELESKEEEEVVPYTGDTRLLNRYAKYEKPSHLTFNGMRPVFKITTARGYTETTTGNHPFLTATEHGEFVWVEAKDLTNGMHIVSRKGDRVFGKNALPYEASYILGAEATDSVPTAILQADEATQRAFIIGFLENVMEVSAPHYMVNGISTEYKLLQQVQLMILNMGYSGKLHRLGITDAEGNRYYQLNYVGEELVKLLSVTLLGENVQEVAGTNENATVVSVEYVGEQPTFDVAMPETHSFVANGMVNHNTEIGSAILKTLTPSLAPNERMVFIVPTKEIFYGAHERIEERLGVKVGLMGDGKRDIQQVTVVLMPTLVSALKDPSKDVKVTAKERVPQIIVQEILPQFKGKKNIKKLLQNYMRTYVTNTKAREQIKEDLTALAFSDLSDAKIQKAMNNYEVTYSKAIEKKAGAKWAKYQETLAFVDSVVCLICDETHRAKGDTWYDTMLKFTNAQYRVGMTGTIDFKDTMLWQKLQGLFGEVVETVANDELIGKGFSAKPFIKFINVKEPRTIANIREYQDVYQHGIVSNEQRNEIIASMCKTVYDSGKTTLIIVNRVGHGDTIKELLDKKGVVSEFINGELESDTRKRQLQDVKEGKLKVLIATTVLDEGVDISGIHCLILGAGGKSLRQTLQRVGRILRRKEGDNSAIVLDFYDRTNKYLLKHSKERHDIYVEQGFDVQFLN